MSQNSIQGSTNSQPDEIDDSYTSPLMGERIRAQRRIVAARASVTSRERAITNLMHGISPELLDQDPLTSRAISEREHERLVYLDNIRKSRANLPSQSRATFPTKPKNKNVSANSAASKFHPYNKREPGASFGKSKNKRSLRRLKNDLNKLKKI
jgi:hypothetical protein